MKVYVSVDMEGISGLVRWADVVTRGIDYPRNRSLMTADANAAIEGALAAGAKEIVVEENHGIEDLCNLLMDEIHPSAEVIRGAGRPGATTMAGLDESVDVVLLIGHHGRAGSFPGVMAHTISYGMFKLVRLQGEPIGEPDFFALRAAELGVPIGMVSGDQVVGQQVSAICPWAEVVEVKHAYARQSARCLSPERARNLIRHGAERAVARAKAGELGLYQGVAAPYDFEVELTKDAPEAMVENLKQLPEFTLTAPRQVQVSAPDMDLGFRRVAYLGYADQPGVTRY